MRWFALPSMLPLSDVDGLLALVRAHSPDFADTPYVRRRFLQAASGRRRRNTVTAYCAVEEIWGASGGTTIRAVIVSLRWLPGELVYRSVGEHLAPEEDRCPASILDLLTPTPFATAQAWRTRCRDQLEASRRRLPAPSAKAIALT